ncbi:hypothetical protein FH972_025204 [Carpinus fangiana]|uniref:Alpha/beta hydrolase fold-3 domain-containing protein n=1 Tax=Carpinus fangiana TaxID=176857 RepID=A0A5N6L1A5_9ROSI|nr:hypothetical protein FH972_025204 [Carpinus fangiana]
MSTQSSPQQTPLDDTLLYETYPGFTSTSKSVHPDLDHTASRRAQFVEENQWASGPHNAPLDYGFETESLQIPARDGTCIDARFYNPIETTKDTRLPLLFIVHGGGWVQGTYITEERWILKPLALTLSTASSKSPARPRPRFRAISIHYRLAPEHPYPTPLNDSWNALSWIAAPAQTARFGIDPQRILVAGSSAGGNIAAALSQLAHDSSPPIPLCGVFLNVPALCHPDHFPKYRYRWESFDTYASPMRVVWQLYLAGDASQGCQPTASPFLGVLEDLPPHFVAIAGSCPLRDEGMAYVRRLREAGVKVEERVYEDSGHTFAEDYAHPKTSQFWADMGACLGPLLNEK